MANEERLSSEFLIQSKINQARVTASNEWLHGNGSHGNGGALD